MSQKIAKKIQMMIFMEIAAQVIRLDMKTLKCALSSPYRLKF